jgi:hypothetical protein
MAPLEDDATPTGNVAGPYDEAARVLAALPRPRRLRMSRQGKLKAIVTTVALAIAVGIFVSGAMRTQPASARGAAASSPVLMFVLPIALVAAVSLVMLAALTRQKRLLAEGEMAVARVTKRGISRNGPNIGYEFTTPLGERLTGSAQDGSRQLSVGMSVPVFYDAQSPKKQVALCGSFYEVVLPGEKLD